MELNVFSPSVSASRGQHWSGGHTLQLSLRWASNAVLPQNSCIVHKGEFEL